MSKNIISPSRRYVFLAALLFLFSGFLSINRTHAGFESAYAVRTPTPKKKATPTPTPAKKAVAKATPTPKKNATAVKKDSPKKETQKSKTTAKAETKSASSKAKPTAKKPESKSNAKTTTAKAAVPDKSKPATAAKKVSQRTRTVKTTTSKTRERNISPPKIRSEIAKSAEGSVPLKADQSQIIVSEVSMRVREQANAGSRELCRLPLGTVLSYTGKAGNWIKASCVVGGSSKSGWIAETGARKFPPSAQVQTFKQIFEKKFSQNMDFATASELAAFLRRVNPLMENDPAAAQMSLSQLLALRIALRALKSENISASLRSDFLKTFQDQIVSSETDGDFYVKSSLFWNLREKYINSPLADGIAWEAAINPLPGKCEGYVNCHLFYVRMTAGEYLSFYPRGSNSSDALKNVTNFLNPIVADIPDKTNFGGPTDVTDRAEFNNLIAELRTIVSRLPNTEKEKTLSQLKQIAEAFR